MDLTKDEFEQEVKKALGFLLEIKDHTQEMDTDDIQDFCAKIEIPLARMLKGLQSGSIKAEKF